jgi:uncharacterized OB-fold protein
VIEMEKRVKYLNMKKNSNIIKELKNSRFKTVMYCIKCGRKSPTNFQYCPKCNDYLIPIPIKE